MSVLPSDLRRQLNKTVVRARQVAEAGARKALEALAVPEAQPYGHMSKDQQALRRALRAQARQLGDSEREGRKGGMDLHHLAEKIAYDQWHRLLFARFLAENQVLYSPDHAVTVSLDDCEELAPSLGVSDRWAVAARFTAKSLPGVFPEDDSAGKIALPVEDRLALIALVTELSSSVFLAGDSLGWVYQFWQEERKKEVNASGTKIGADELPAVTQLFTEDYMVDFLLDNTLGAWHAGKVLSANAALAESSQTEEDMRAAVSLPSVPWQYLRFKKGDDAKWTPAAGTFDGWPKAAKELKCLDPCMGSGHFVVAMFERLVALRLAEERLDEAAAVAAVIRDNLFGLEIDPRCTQIGAFNLALAAWRRVGHRKLPTMNLACSGLAPNSREADWLSVTAKNQKLQRGMERLYRLFEQAAVLGSLINPRADEGDLLVAAFHELEPLLEKAMAQEFTDDTAHEMAVTACGLAKAADILAGKFTLVATNVPYLGRPKQNEILKDFCERFHPDAKADLGACFVKRCLDFCATGGRSALVTPQNWLFQPGYKKMREVLLSSAAFSFIAKIGPKGFQTPMWDFNVMLVSLERRHPTDASAITGLDVSSAKDASAKSVSLLSCEIVVVGQEKQRKNPDCVIALETLEGTKVLKNHASCVQGLATSDDPQFTIAFWELAGINDGWEGLLGTVPATINYGGRERLIHWQNGTGRYFRHAQSLKAEGRLGGWKSGTEARGKKGILVSQMSAMPVTLYTGEFYDHNASVIVPTDPICLPAIWAMCGSRELAVEVRKIDQSLKPSNNVFVKVPFDLAYWQKVAAEKYPHGLPKPFSSDPTQWLFNGHPAGADQPLHVAVARLLGYQWPRLTGSSFPDCPALGQDGLEKLADDDGIVCLSATKGEAPGAERLRDLLATAFGAEWSAARQAELLAQTGSPGKTLEDWLRNDFCEQHGKIFQSRPFIWQVWDRHKSGFNALINCHRLNHANLEKLTYTYLGDWISRQKAAVAAGEEGGDARLEAARELQEQLRLILEGESPYDIFVRWKPLEKQALGWEPDLNDGVRMNIRPFVVAEVLRKQPKIDWKKDRGKDPESAPWFQTFNGERINDHHLTLAEKRKAREGKKR